MHYLGQRTKSCNHASLTSHSFTFGFLLASSDLGITPHDEGRIGLNMKRNEFDSGEAQLRVHACKKCLVLLWTGSQVRLVLHISKRHLTFTLEFFCYQV